MKPGRTHFITTLKVVLDSQLHAESSGVIRFPTGRTVVKSGANLSTVLVSAPTFFRWTFQKRKKGQHVAEYKSNWCMPT